MEITIESSYKDTLVKLYPIEDEKWNSIVEYCSKKVKDYVQLKAHINVENLTISPFKQECLNKAVKAEIEAYLSHDGDYKDMSIVELANNSITIDDIMLCPIAAEWVRRAGFLYRGIG